MHDLPLAIFTVLSQLGIGAFITMWILELRNKKISDQTGLFISISITSISALSVLFSLFHLGQPFFAFRAVYNIGVSWLSREVASFSCFILLSALYTYFWWKKDGSKRITIGILGSIIGITTIFSSAMIYVIPAVPAWNDISTIIAFFMTGIVLGPLFTGVFLVWKKELSYNLSKTTLIGLSISVLTFIYYTVSLFTGLPEAAASGNQMMDNSMFWIRIIVLFIALLMFVSAQLRRKTSNIMFFSAGFLLILASEFLGRVLFYTTAIHL